MKLRGAPRAARPDFERDLALQGEIATIDAVEEDLEGNVYYAVPIAVPIQGWGEIPATCVSRATASSLVHTKSSELKSDRFIDMRAP